MINTIGSFLSYAVIAVFAQNIVLSGATPFGIINMYLQKPRRLAQTSALVSVFSLLAALTLLPFDYIAPMWSSPVPVRAVMLCAAVLLWYLIFSAVLSRLERFKETAECLPTGALNGAVMVMPLILDINAVSDPVRVCGLAAGSGAGFALAAWLLMCGLRRADNPDIPELFRGTPIMLIYLGLLSLAFSIFGGGISLFP